MSTSFYPYYMSHIFLLNAIKFNVYIYFVFFFVFFFTWNFPSLSPKIRSLVLCSPKCLISFTKSSHRPALQFTRLTSLLVKGKKHFFFQIRTQLPTFSKKLKRKIFTKTIRSPNSLRWTSSPTCARQVHPILPLTNENVNGLLSVQPYMR